MERVYDHTDNRTKRAVSRVLIASSGWGNSDLNAFDACKSSLANQVTIAHLDPSKRFCVYIAASDHMGRYHYRNFNVEYHTTTQRVATFTDVIFVWPIQ